MADIEQKWSVEHAHETQNLTYGHFGSARYEHRTSHTWRFLRQDHQSDEPKPAVQEIHPEPKPYHGLQLQHQRLIKTPGQSPGVELKLVHQTGPNHLSHTLCHYLGLGFVSRTLFDGDTPIQADSDEHSRGPIGQLLGYGFAAGLDSTGRYDESEGAPIVALAVGAAGDVLWATELATTPVSNFDNPELESEPSAPAMSEYTLGQHSHPPGPILQVCFSRLYHNGGTLIGIRRASSTTFIRPVYDVTQQPETLSQSATCSSLPATVRLEPMMMLPTSRTGGHAHADLAFDPKDARQLAIIDTHGNWSIWEIDVKHTPATRMSSSARLKASGKIFRVRTGDSRANPYHDGWHKICWLVDEDEPSSMLLVCNRERAEVYTVEGQALGQVDMRLGVRSKEHWIWDVQRCNTFPNMVFILTSTRVLVMRIGNARSGQDFGNEPLDLSCSWSHFRAHSDLTMRISVLELHNGVIYLHLLSKYNKQVTVYPLSIEPWEDGSVISAGDPSSMPMHSHLSQGSEPILDMAFQVMATRDRLNVSHVRPNRTLVWMMARLEDGTVIESIYTYASDEKLKSSATENRTAMLTPSRKIQRIRSSKFVDHDDLLDFVVDDALVARINTLSLSGVRSAREIWQARVSSSNTKHWADVLSVESMEKPELALGTALENLRASMHQALATLSAGQTLAESLPGVQVNDIEDASERTSAWIDQASIAEMDASTNGVVPTLVNAQVPSVVLGRYHDLVDQHVGTFSEEIPDRIRVRAERLSRAVGLDTALASYALRRPRRKGFQSSHMSEAPSLQDNSTRSERLLAVAGSPSDVHPVSSTQETALSRLSNYTTINNTEPWKFNAKAVYEVLDHLPLDFAVDPSDYSYKDAELQLAMARNELEIQMDPRAKRHAEKLAAKEKKRLERDRRIREEVALKRAMIPNVVMASQLPRIETQSQGPLERQTLSSQDAGRPGLSMTQPERGVHGGREVLRKTVSRSRRVQGF